MAVVVSKEILEIGRTEGIPVPTILDLANQFSAVYPDEWERLLVERLHADGKDRARVRRVEEKQRQLQSLRRDVATAKNEDLEPALDEEIKKLESELTELAKKRAKRSAEKVAVAKAAAKGGEGDDV
jgi:hypothetical protein